MARKQQLINLLSNFANLFTNILLGLFFTPYLVKTLGIAAYGVLPLALLINSYINVVTGALIGSMSRFYSIELVAERYKEASEYLGISYWLINQLVRKKQIPYCKVGGKYLFRVQALDEYLKNMELQSMN